MYSGGLFVWFGLVVDSVDCHFSQVGVDVIALCFDVEPVALVSLSLGQEGQG